MWGTLVSGVFVGATPRKFLLIVSIVVLFAIGYITFQSVDIIGIYSNSPPAPSLPIKTTQRVAVASTDYNSAYFEKDTLWIRKLHRCG